MVTNSRYLILIQMGENGSTSVDSGIFTCIGRGVMPAGGREGESLVILLR